MKSSSRFTSSQVHASLGAKFAIDLERNCPTTLGGKDFHKTSGTKSEIENTVRTNSRRVQKTQKRRKGLRLSRPFRPLPLIRGSGLPNVTCKVQAPLQDAPFYILHFTFYTLPARWWTQDAAHRSQRSLCFPPTTKVHQQKTAELYQMPPLDATDVRLTITHKPKSTGCSNF